MELNNILVSRKDNIVIVTMNRPNVLNALNGETMKEIEGLFLELAQDRTILGVILTGAGRAFVSGADITEVTQIKDGESPNLSEHFLDYLQLVRRAYDSVCNFPRPVIAAVNGFALGGGFELALCCDLIVASTKAAFGLPEGKLGLLPSYGGTQRLSRRAGASVAKELLFTARFVKGPEAKELGLVDKLVEPDDLLPTAEELLRSMQVSAPIAMKLMKIAVDKGIDVPLSDGLALEQTLGSLCLGTEDAKEGIAAFVEKRTPVFKNN